MRNAFRIAAWVLFALVPIIGLAGLALMGLAIAIFGEGR